jgi:hypothetical protein
MLIRAALCSMAMTLVILSAHSALAKSAWPFRVTYHFAHPVSHSDIAAIVSVVSHREEGSHHIVWVEFQTPIEAQAFIKDGEVLTLRKRHARWFIDPWVVGSWQT